MKYIVNFYLSHFFSSKIKQFADDATCTLKDWASVNELFQTTKAFKIVSGLNLNENKTLLVYLGPWRIRTDCPLNLPVEQTTFNILGIQVGRDILIQNLQNYGEKIKKLENTLRMWSSRQLSLLGKVLVTKSQGISNLIYALSNIEVDNRYLEQAQRIITNFVWGSKFNRIKHSTMIADFESGGIKMPDLKCIKMSLRMPWIARILENKPWSCMIRKRLEKYGGLSFLLRCNYDTKSMTDIPVFYREMLVYSSYVLFNEHSIDIIWNNKDIKINGKTIYWDEWKAKGIIYSVDLKDEGGK